MNTTVFVDIFCDGYRLSLLAVVMGHLDWCQMGKNFGTRHDGSHVTSFRNEAAVCLICYLHHTYTYTQRKRGRGESSLVMMMMVWLRMILMSFRCVCTSMCLCIHNRTSIYSSSSSSSSYSTFTTSFICCRLWHAGHLLTAWTSWLDTHTVWLWYCGSMSVRCDIRFLLFWGCVNVSHGRIQNCYCTI